MTENLEERIADLQNGFYLIQDHTEFCFGADAVILSDFTDIHSAKKENILDLGCGNGILPLLLFAKGFRNIHGLELQKKTVDLAQRNLKLNSLENEINILHGDIREIKSVLKGRKFNMVISNPPYIKHKGGLLNEKESVAIARHEICCTLDDLVKAAAYVLNSSGKFYFIHRAYRLADIIVTLRKYNFEPKIIRFVHSYENTQAVFVLVQASKNGKGECKVLKPLILYPGIKAEG